MMRVHNWAKFQHYRHRRPPWVKLHKSLLDDMAFHRLRLASRALAPCIWLVASETDDGSLPDIETLAFRLREDVVLVEQAVQDLINHGFIEGELHHASTMQAPCKQNGVTETETETEAEKRNPPPTPPLRGGGGGVSKATSPATSPYSEDFLAFWAVYPRKVGKGAAWTAWKKARGILPPMETLLAAVRAQAASDQWTRDGGQYIPHPATWLHQRRWEDEAPPPAAPKAQQAGGTPEMIERLAAIERTARMEQEVKG